MKVIERLEALTKCVKPGDTFLFYFAGHGCTREGQQFLVTENADITTKETMMISAIPLNLLKAQMAKIAAWQAIFFFDASRNEYNPAEESRAGGNPRADEPSMALDDAGGRLGSWGLFFACAADEYAWAPTELGHGVFSYYLYQGLCGDAAGPTGQLTLDDLVDYTWRHVANWCDAHHKPQHPDLFEHARAKIVLADNLHTTVPNAR